MKEEKENGIFIQSYVLFQNHWSSVIFGNVSNYTLGKKAFSIM